MQAPSPLLDRAALERLERLAIRWRQSFRGLLGGNNLSRYAGVGHEFMDHRHFHPGDDLRSVNWRAYLRLERLFLKMFQTEPRAPVRLWVDTSESMACGHSSGGGGEPKFAYACRLAAALCYVGLVRLEAMTIQPFSRTLGDDFRAQGGRHRFAPASRFLEGLSTAGRSDFLAVVRQFLARRPQAGMMVILSDFLDDGGSARALEYLADHGQELLLVQLAGPEDRHPRWQGEFDLVDAESGEVLRLDLDRESLRQYEAAYEEHCQAIEYVALRSGGRRVHLTTDVPLADVLSTAFIPAGSVSLH